MIKKEARFTIIFRHWMMTYPKYTSGAFELKQTQTDSIPFSDVKEHQLDALYAVKHGGKGFLYKAADDSRAIKPFDLFFLRLGIACVVIKYPGFFCIIDIDTFIQEKKRSERKSLTAERAKEVASEVVELKK